MPFGVDNRQGLVVVVTRVAPQPTDRRSRTLTGPRLLERGQFLSEFEAVFTQSLNVPSRCIAIEGPWGSGRTALVNAACRLASHAGCLVLRARGGDVERQIPYGVLRRFVESAAGQMNGSDAVLEQVAALEGLIRPGGDVRRTPNEVSHEFYALVLALREIGPVLLSVDDADLADRETLAVLQYVVRRLESQQIWLLVSTRPLHPGVGLRPIELLLTEPEIRQFTLDPLRPEAVRTMLAGFFDEEPDPRFVTACYDATGGLPLLLKALLSSLGHRRVHPSADMAPLVERIPVPKITQLVLSRLAHLSVAASDLLQACAILGDRADPSVARELAKIDALAAERAADAAAQAELVRPGRPITFLSPLIRWAIYYDIPTARRSQFHARAARLLAEHGAGVTTTAEHLLTTEPAGDLETADRLQKMGRVALAAGDVDLALRCFNRALVELPPSNREGGLYLDLASAEIARRRPSALLHFRRALQLGLPDNAAVIRVAVGLLHMQADMPHLRDETVGTVGELRSRLDMVDRDLQVEFELALTMASSHPEERSQGLKRLKVLLTGPGSDRHAMARTAGVFLDIHEAAGSSIASVELAERLTRVLSVDQLLSSDPIVVRVQTLACYGLLCTDHFESVDAILRGARERTRATERVQAGARVSVLSAISLLWQGSLTEAEEECRRRCTPGGQPEFDRRRPIIGLVDALIGQGKVDEAARISDSMPVDEIEDPMLRGLARLERGRLLVASGREKDGLAELLDVGDDALAAGIINPAMSSWRADAAMVLAGIGEWDEAGRLAHEHLRLARSFGALRTTGVGLRAVAAATPDLAKRTTLLAEAVHLLEPSPVRLEAANALVELGTVLVERKKKEEARGVLRRGANLASMCGAHQLVETAGIQLRAAGARPRRLGSTGPDSLTPAELRVVRLAATGKTNQGIATDLYISVKTVEGHLAKAYRKLGVESRRSLAVALAGDDEFLNVSSL